MKRICFALCFAAALSPFTATQGATISYDAGKSMTTTNWSDQLSFARFDGSLGTLTSVRFDLAGSVDGQGSAESLDAEQSDVTLALGSLLTLSRPDGSMLVLTNPLFSRTVTLSAWDGATDFAGTSGTRTGPVSVSGADYFVSASAADLALFTAPGGDPINLRLSASGTSNASGAGNLVTQFSTAASGTARVTYAFTPTATVPEPASVALMCAGLGLLGVARRRTRAAA